MDEWNGEKMGKKYKIKRKVDYKPDKNRKYKIKRIADYDPKTGKMVKRKVELNEEIIDICHKIRKYTNRIEEAIRKDKQELEQQKQEMK